MSREQGLSTTLNTGMSRSLCIGKVVHANYVTEGQGQCKVATKILQNNTILIIIPDIAHIAVARRIIKVMS